MSSTFRADRPRPANQGALIAGRYVVERPLGKGGAAQVFCVTDRSRGGQSAVRRASRACRASRRAARHQLASGDVGPRLGALHRAALARRHAHETNRGAARAADTAGRLTRPHGPSRTWRLPAAAGKLPRGPALARGDARARATRDRRLGSHVWLAGARLQPARPARPRIGDLSAREQVLCRARLRRLAHHAPGADGALDRGGGAVPGTVRPVTAGCAAGDTSRSKAH